MVSPSVHTAARPKRTPSLYHVRYFSSYLAPLHSPLEGRRFNSIIAVFLWFLRFDEIVEADGVHNEHFEDFGSNRTLFSVSYETVSYELKGSTVYHDRV